MTPKVPNLKAYISALPPEEALKLKALRLRVRAGYPRLARQITVTTGSVEGLRRTLDTATEQYGKLWKRFGRRRLPWVEGLASQDQPIIEASYPTAYWLLAEAAGRLHGVSTWWLLAHMLQESRFKERAHSHAGALGPMQVLPRTGRRIAAKLGVPAGDFFAAQLFEPGIALRHAAWYLAALRHEFGGSLPLAVAAYNGGPRRFATHVREYSTVPFDVMMEEIGADESRNYARKVSDHLVRWVSIYGSDAEQAAVFQALLPPAKVPQARGVTRF